MLIKPVLPCSSIASTWSTNQARRGTNVAEYKAIHADDFDQDKLYLSPLIREIEAELKEREDLEVMVPKKKS